MVLRARVRGAARDLKVLTNVDRRLIVLIEGSHSHEETGHTQYIQMSSHLGNTTRNAMYV